MILRYNWDIYSKRDALNLCGSISPCKNMGSFLDVTADVWLYPTFMIYDLSLDTPAPNKIKMGPTLVNATRSPFFVRKVSHVFPTTPRFSGSLSCLQDTKYKPMPPHVATQSLSCLGFCVQLQNAESKTRDTEQLPISRSFIQWNDNQWNEHLCEKLFVYMVFTVLHPDKTPPCWTHLATWFCWYEGTSTQCGAGCCWGHSLGGKWREETGTVVLMIPKHDVEPRKIS